LQPSPRFSRVTIQDVEQRAHRVVAGLGDGLMSPTAYDTAWVARIQNPTHPDDPMFPATYDWLLTHQHADGSWGGEIPFAHDRVVCTLAALLALSGSTYRTDESEIAVRRAIVYLNRTDLDLQGVPAETVGFELILPELMRQAQAKGLRLPYEQWRFVEAIQAVKLQRIPPIVVYGGPNTLTTSLEYLGDRVLPELLPRCQSDTGSYGCSPSATSYAFLHRPESSALRYLQRVATMRPDGGVLFLWPFEVFESAWALYYLADLPLDPEVVQPSLARLRAGLTPAGTSWTRHGMPSDVDDTAVTLYVLHRYGESISGDVFAQYEAPEHFYTFPLERDPSITSNAHVFETLRALPSSVEQRRMMLKVVHFLRQSQVQGRYWHDKWHTSPLYAVEQVIRAVAGWDNDFVRPIVQWVVETQHEDGSWGVADGNAEETAIALRSVLTAAEHDAALSRTLDDTIERGGQYLLSRFGDENHPALWLGKALYTPPNIVEAIILGALYQWLNHKEALVQ
jgi:halimadienyl-diphosphate synthase